jgi:glycosyltransferase involved in cell wall biosynthesis
VLPRRPLRSLKTLFSVLFAPYPMLADVNGLAAPLQQRFRELLEEPWDVIQIEHSYSFQPFEQPLKQLQRPFILTEHNVESALGAASYDRLPAWSKPFTRYDQWRYRRWERRVFQQAARVIAVTEQDALTLARLSGKPAAVVVNGVDCGHYAAVQPDLGSQRLLFIGNYEYSPNLDAVQWALEEILPRLWAINPEVHFAICGYALPDSFRQRWTDPRIEWQGFVPDLRDLQRRSALFFAPLRQGGGSKLKVLEAMAAGLPVVTTAQGSSGLQVENGQHYLGSEDPGALAQILAQALADPERLQRIGAAGRDYVLAHHDWTAAAAQLEAVYHQLPSDKEEVSVCA